MIGGAAITGLITVALFGVDANRLETVAVNGSTDRLELSIALSEAGLPHLATALLVEVLVLDRSDPVKVAKALRFYPLSLRGAPAPAQVLGALAESPDRSLDDAQRSVRAFLIGQAVLASGQPRRALTLLRQVSPGSVAYAPARFLIGVAQATPPLNDLKAAGLAFQQAIIEAETSPQAPRKVVGEARRLSLLNLARLYFEVSNIEVALYYYERLPRGSAEQVEAGFESAWAHLLRGDMHRALGELHGARAPSNAHPARAEMHMVAGAALLGLCHGAKGRVELDALENRYLVHLKALEAFAEEAARRRDPRWFTQQLGGGSTLPAPVRRSVLEQAAVVHALAEQAAVEEELRRVATSGLTLPAIDQRAEPLRQRYAARVVVAVRQAAKALTADWKRLQDARAELMIDLLEAEGDQLEADIRAGTSDVPVPQAARAPALGQDWQRWRFTGELWRDELGSHRSTLPSLCERAKEEEEG